MVGVYYRKERMSGSNLPKHPIFSLKNEGLGQSSMLRVPLLQEQDNQLCPSIELQEACSPPFSLLRATSELHEQVTQEVGEQDTVRVVNTHSMFCQSSPENHLL